MIPLPGEPNPQRLVESDDKVQQSGFHSFEYAHVTEAEDKSLCDVCRGIDFSGLFYGEKSPRQPFTLCKLTLIATSNCPFCRFLRACVPSGWFQEEQFSGRFVLRRAGPLFGYRGLGDSPAFQIHAVKPATGKGNSDGSRWILPISVNSAVSARHPSEDKIDENVIKEWLDLCNKTHGDCKDEGGFSITSMRAIDCTNNVIIAFPSDISEYVTLSYVWGTSTDCSFDRPPKVIEDAMSLVRQLGFRYLWIDRYCIPQDDLSAKQLQIWHMDKIYANSTLTIIVAAGTGPEHGIPGVGSTPKLPNPSIRIGHHRLVGIIPPKTDIQQSKWNTRGWTYQEALLSKRRLVFTDTQTYFQCQAMHCTDAIDVPLKGLHTRHGTLIESVDIGKTFPSKRRLRNVHIVGLRIAEFLSRDLSVETDVLDAISGVLTTYRELSDPVNFLCGLPVFSLGSWVPKNAKTMINILCHALLWTRKPGMQRRFSFPSWTWAGWKYSYRPIDDPINCILGLGASRPYGYFLYLGPRVEVIFPDGTALNWEDFHGRILDLSNSGIYPNVLRIAGWTFQGTINYNEGWKFSSPPAVYDQELSQLEMPLGKSNVHAVLALTFVRNWTETIYSLILKPIKNSSLFERVSVERQNCSDTKFKVLEPEKLAQCGELQLQWREVLLN